MGRYVYQVKGFQLSINLNTVMPQLVLTQINIVVPGYTEPTGINPERFEECLAP